MSESPVFASKWDFLAATVLFGVRAGTDELLLGSEPTGPVWVCWTDPLLAEHQLPPGYVLNQGRVSVLLPLLPDGVSVRIDPGRPSGMQLDPGYRAELVALCLPFPAGHAVDLGPIECPASCADALRTVARDRAFVDRIWFFRYRIEDGPPQGCLAVEGPQGPEAWEAALDDLTAALDRTLADTDLARALADVHVLPVDGLLAEVGAWLRERPPVAP